MIMKLSVVTVWLLKNVKICEENQEWNTQLTEVMKAQALLFFAVWQAMT